MVEAISHADDPRLAEYRGVPDRHLMQTLGVFVAEGRLLVRRALQSGWRVRSVLVTPSAHRSLADALDGSPVRVFVAAPDVLVEVTGFNFHRGCLALVERRPALDWRPLVAHRGGRRMLALDRIGNADNIGGIFRNAAAFGADAVLLGPGCHDPLYRKALRTSMGAALSVPFARFPSWNELAQALQDCGWTAAALTPRPDALALGCDGARGGGHPLDRLALLLGSEATGLSAEALALARVSLRIPISAGVDSLNVATAAGIALYALGPSP